MKKIVQFLLSRLDLLILVTVVLSLAFWRDTSFKNTTGYETVSPKIVVENMKPCLLNNNEWTFVDKFYIRDEQHICAEMKSDVYPVRLTLIIQKEDSVFSTEYVNADQFTGGMITFQISPKLKDGQYIARISYARETLAKLTFEVM